MRLKPDISEYHYLVVDDDVLSSTLVVNMLNKLKAGKVNIAENGEVALACIGAGRNMPDIIISDLSMPRLDGVEFMRRLAEMQFAGGIILMSTSDKRVLRMVVNLAEEHKLDVLGALSKPFSLLDLEDLIVRYNKVKAESSRLALPPPRVTPETLREAIEQHQIVPFFQPKVVIKTGQVVGVEALARWQHPQGGIVPPIRFIPVAEQHGLIDLLTQGMFKKTLEQAEAWHKSGLPFTFAINMSAPLLVDVTLPDRLEAALDTAGIAPSYLTLEVTESCLIANTASILETLLRLRLKGIRLSVDDFGTGHSSLEDLHKLPFTELKLDRVFVNGAAHDEESRAFLQSSVSLAKKLNLNIVAEGVETQEEWDFCAKLGCDMVQGYLISRPLAGGAFLDWFHKRQGSIALSASRRIQTRVQEDVFSWTRHSAEGTQL